MFDFWFSGLVKNLWAVSEKRGADATVNTLTQIITVNSLQEVYEHRNVFCPVIRLPG